ncbi:tRNA pseudouridine(65) synthase TruC [Orbus mooreae]|uniref:tRNA pseudouridine(65) synthase TruC n=1 Tax=Orbus mooreae TaxID=3074107 RepID=UPI00370D7474
MFDILYHDQYLVAINKPSGWLVHRSWLDRHEKVVVMQTLRDQIGQHVFPVHRLDRPTSGVLLFALSAEIANLLAQQFASRQPQKTYHAIVRGFITQSGHIDYPLVEELDKIADKFADKNRPAQSAITDYAPISTIELPIAVGKHSTARYSFIELKPHTGRKHQLRRHMKHIFHPILGDSKHGDLHQNRAFSQYFDIKRLMLHASELAFEHPISQARLVIQAPLDTQWLDILSQFNPHTTTAS